MNNEDKTQVNSNPQEATQSVQPPNPFLKEVPKTPTQENPAVAQPLENQVSEGVNLIPSMTKEEKTHVKKKNTLNIGSVLSIIVLATIAIAIVGFNIISKAQLNTKKASLARIEKSVNSKTDKIISNNAILSRVKLYEEVKKGSFSHKKIIEFLNEMAGKVSGISYRSITISEELDFEVSGKSPDLEQLSRLWYLLGINENIETINLGSVSKGDDGATFSFEGKLILDNFKND